MKKKLVCLLTAFALAAGMAACGGNSDAGSSAPSESSQPESSAPEADAPAGTPTESESAPAPAAGQVTFKLGGTGPLTGAAAIYGTAAANGA